MRVRPLALSMRVSRLVVRVGGSVCGDQCVAET